MKLFNKIILSMFILLVIPVSSFSLDVVKPDPGYYPSTDIGRPVALADIYVGIINLDPEIPENQKQISVRQENGSVVQVPQPMHTGAGGVPEYLGSPVTILVDGGYSLKVLDQYGSQVYYIPESEVSISGLISVDHNSDGTHIVYESIADLRASTLTPFNSQVVQLTGYYASTENQKWRYQWDASSTETDDGGKVIKVTSITTGRWKLLFKDFITAKQYGAVGDGVSDDSAFLLSWVTNATNMHLTSGTYLFSTPWIFTGKHRNYKADYNAILKWDGSTSGSAISYGDGGTTDTEHWLIEGLRVIDSVGIDVLVHIDQATRMQFYGTYLAGSYTVTAAEKTLLLHESAWINSFYDLRLLFGHTGLELGAGTNATNFYGCIIEGQEQFGVRVRENSTLHSVNFYGGTIESIKNAATDGIAFSIEHPVDGLFITGVYFESSDTHITLSHGVSTHGFHVTVRDCYFTSVTTAAASIVHSSDIVLNLYGNDYHDAPLVEMTVAEAIVYADGNYSRDNQDLAIKTLGVLAAYKMKHGSGAGLKLNSHPVPEVEFGSTGTIGASSSLAVVFNEPFLVAPTAVTVTHAAGTARDGVLTIGSITTTGFTVYNNATQATSGNYIAMAEAK